ncbi:MAG: hypothetical protein H6834_18320 [Planctomycetes bacterium]|nr:hypothetical protein [Planctomycetota bacterium]MCB9892233.1 hypothetical protein [Planctomycetota bacterium]
MRTLQLTAAILLIASLGHAQSLIGLSDGSTSVLGTTTYEFDAGCNVIDRCPTPFPFPGSPVPFPAGGIAYDPTHRTIWATDGRQLVQYDERCSQLQLCPLPPTATGPWTGLAIDWDAGRLFHTENSNTIYVSNLGCPQSAPTALCTVGPALLTPPLTGIEKDPWDRSFWVTDQYGVVANVGASGSLACTILNVFQIRCPNASWTLPVRGITVDRCRNVVHISDSAGNLATADLTTGQLVNCCQMQVPQLTLVGLARHPERVRSRGVGCSSGACGPCIPLATTSGEASIPNGSFSIDLSNAPNGSRGFLLLSTGGGPVSTPLLCGPLHIDLLPPPISLGPVPVTGSGGPCSGHASIGGPIIADPAFCGAVVYAQWMTLCLNTPIFGHALSNGLVIPFS